MSPPSPLQDRLLRVRGTVQGVGFRPFVHRVASELGVRGWVRNDAQGVLLRAVGDPALLDELASRVLHRAPVAARVVGADWVEATAEPPAPERGFLIHESREAVGAIETSIPVDLAPCADCRRELRDPDNRRHGYAFINCTQCGPRYSLIESLPYDRPRTTMRCFAMCPSCRSEYEDPADRRFHAEPNACPVCGPRVRLVAPDGEPLAEGPSALKAAAAALCRGRIVAVKGVGGFHLMVAATHTDRPFWSGCLGLVPVSEDSQLGGRLESLHRARHLIRYPHGDLKALGEACERALEVPVELRRQIYTHYNQNETVGQVVTPHLAASA